MTLQEYNFIRYGTAFIILGFLACCIPGVIESPKNTQRNELNNAVSNMQREVDSLWRASEVGGMTESALYSSKVFGIEYVLKYGTDRQLRTVLESLSLIRYEHDADAIRLRGALKNYLDALDKAESERIIELLPEVKQDKEA